MAFASTSWSYDGSPASLRRERRRASPAVREQRRPADASSPSPAEKHLADLQARGRAASRARSAAGGPAAALPVQLQVRTRL